MKVVLAGGTGQVGRNLQRLLAAQGNDVVVLSRRVGPTESGCRLSLWDGRTPGDWFNDISGADVVINLAGRSVSCRYTEENLKQMMDSRIDSTKVMGQAIAAADQPPSLWLQMSTATIYANTRVGTNDEATGIIGGNEPDVPAYWEYSVRIAKNWEAAQMELDLPHTRRVALRSAMVMTSDRGGIFDVLLMLARLGLGGAVAGGKQRVSWIHGDDFERAIVFLMNDSTLTGPVNLCSPEPVTQAVMMKELRKAWGQRIGLPATARMAAIGAWALGSDPELLLKSRSVVPGRLQDAGFEFHHPTWQAAAGDLVQRSRTRPEGTRLTATISDVIKLSRS